MHRYIIIVLVILNTVLGKLEYKSKCFINNIPCWEASNAVNYKTKNRDKRFNKYVAGYGINLLTGITTSFQDIPGELAKMNHNNLYNLNIGPMNMFQNFLKPNMIFRILIGEHNKSESKTYKSTLLYIDSDGRVVTVTRKLNKIIKTLLYIWMITHDLLRIEEEDQYRQRYLMEQEDNESTLAISDINGIRRNCRVLRGPEMVLENISDEDIRVYKNNIMISIRKHLTLQEREAFSNALDQEILLLPSIKQFESYRRIFERLYDALKCKMYKKYESFPIYKILNNRSCDEDSLGPKKSKEIVKDEFARKYLEVYVESD
ncbi:hypothetical protein NGRA_0058 [Nosema granulosis]|uniref:Uncharacterized protein n=1 Tax=Nosema granulosis TaxID=83296 RepID=A0A9P6H1L7_9MICR|nr:hypothetical protein NGRA_0058 [Nosema granulosis]